MTRALLLALACAASLSACGPQPNKDGKTPPASSALKTRKCPDLDIRELKDPCSVAYLPPHKPRFKDDILK